ncbi:DUF2813 domain-containing protein [Escherichia coli]
MAITVFLSSGRGECGRRQRDDTAQFFSIKTDIRLMSRILTIRARHLVRLMPVLRLRDARFMRRIRNGTVPNVPNVEVTARQLDFLARELSLTSAKISLMGRFVRDFPQWYSCLSIISLSRGPDRRDIVLMRRRASNEQRSWRYLDIINRMIDRPGGRSYRVILLGLFATLLQAKGTLRLDKDARPLLLIEDPETRLHPIMLSVAPASVESSAIAAHCHHQLG